MPDITFPQQLGMQAAGNVVGGGMGLLLQGINNKQQIKQQQKLTDMQIAAQKQMGIFNREQQMQLWNDTNYAAQKEQMKKAGLSPGLMYGTSGGGATTASATPGNLSAPTARQSNESLGMGLQMGQAAMMQAQIQALKAQTANTNADTLNKQAENPNIPKQGKLLDTQTASLSQGIDNQKAQKELIELDAQFNSVRNEIQAKSMNDQIATIKYQMQQAYALIGKLENEKSITGTEARWKENQIKAELALMGIEGYLKSEEAKGIQQGVRESIERISDMINDNMIGAMEQSNKNYQQEMEIQAPDDLPEGVKSMLQILGIATILKGTKGKHAGESTPYQGKVNIKPHYQ